MTPEETRQAAAVMLAFAEGKEIEFNAGFGDGWEPCPYPVWTWDGGKYRVKPEPWQGRIWVHPETNPIAFHVSQTQEKWTEAGWRLITAKEVEP